MLHPLIYESWTAPDHVCLIIHRSFCTSVLYNYISNRHVSLYVSTKAAQPPYRIMWPSTLFMMAALRGNGSLPLPLLCSGHHHSLVVVFSINTSSKG